MGSTKLIGQIHWSLFIVYYFCFLICLFLAQLDSAHMRARRCRRQLNLNLRYTKQND